MCWKRRRLPRSVQRVQRGRPKAPKQGRTTSPESTSKFGNLARFSCIDPVDSDHPLVTDGDYIIVPPKGTDGSVSEVRLYDQVIVEGQNLYDGKLLS